MPRCNELAVIDRNRSGPGFLCAEHLDVLGGDSKDDAGADNRDANPGDAEEQPYDGIDWSDTELDTYAPAQMEREQLTVRVGKKPFAPWGDPDYPAPCNRDEHDAETTDECECDARWKWSITDHHTDEETVAMYDNDPKYDGRAYIQRKADPNAYVDGDDVVNEDGEVHPAFIDILNELGVTFAEISDSEGGVHALYEGELPEGVKEASWQLDTEPWGEHDDLPSVEIYDGKRVLALSGKYVTETADDIEPWNDDALYDLLDANDQLPEPVSQPSDARDEFDMDDYTPDKTGSDETTDNIRDIFAALDRIDPQHVAKRTIVHRWNDDATTSDGTRAFFPTWGKNSNGTANIVNDKVWHDTGDVGGYGGPVVMALIGGNEISNRNASPKKVDGHLWWKGVRELRSLGYDIPKYEASDDEDGEHVAILPKLSPKALGGGWVDARDSSTDPLTQQDVYDRVRGEQLEAMESGENIVLDGIMGGGKTYNAFAALAERDEAGSYFAPRVELYDQAVEYAMANGFTRDECHILPSISRHCPTWNGEHGEDQRGLVHRLHALGVQPKTIHNLLGDELGCKQNDSGKCEYEHQWNFDPDDYPVLIGHYSHAHLTHVTAGRHCIFDEDPTDAFTAHIGGRELTKGINAFLDLHDSPAFDGWDDLIQNRNDADRREAGLEWFDRPEFDFEPDERNAVRYENEGFHAYAPLAVYTILAAEPLEDGYPFEQASLPGLGNSGRFFTTSEQYGDYYVEIATPPALDYTSKKAVIALDGTPLVQEGDPIEWKNALDRPMDYRRVLSDDERAEFLTETLGNTYIQSSEHVKPYSSGRYNQPEDDAALLAAVREQYGDGAPAVVFTGKTVCDEYEERGFVDENLAKTFDYPGNLRGSDEYGSERLGVQLGSSHHGDHEVRRRAAALGVTVNPEGKGIDRDYGSDIGNGVVHQMREAQTAQNALRVGRDGHGAVFIFDTCAFPDWMPVKDDLATVSRWTDTEHAVRGAWDEFDNDDQHNGFTTAEIAESIDRVGSRQVRRALSKFAEKELLAKERDPDDGRRVLWVDDGLGDLEPASPSEVDFPEIETDGGGKVPDISRTISLYARCPQPPTDARAERGVAGESEMATTDAGEGGGLAHDPAD